jgi:hypothetical protein
VARSAGGTLPLQHQGGRTAGGVAAANGTGSSSSDNRGRGPAQVVASCLETLLR